MPVWREGPILSGQEVRISPVWRPKEPVSFRPFWRPQRASGAPEAMVVDQLGWPERWEARKLPVSRLVEAGDPLWTWRHCPKFGAKLLRQISAEFGPIRGNGPANRLDVGFLHPVDPTGSSQIPPGSKISEDFGF